MTSIQRLARGAGRLLFVLGVAGSALVFVQLPLARAATFTVNDTADAPDANLGDGQCRTAGNVCTLRAAVQEANNSAGADTVSLPAGTYTLTRTGANETGAATGDLDIDNGDLTISGAGSATTTIAAAGTFGDRVFEVICCDWSVTISGVTIRGGNVSANGGGIAAQAARLTLSDVVLDGNTASADGGGLWVCPANAPGTFTATDLTLTRNTAPSGGGAAVGAGSGCGTSASLTRITATDNSANVGTGGAISASGPVTIDSLTATGNSAPAGGALSIDRGVIVTNSVISQNTAFPSPGGNAGGGVLVHFETPRSVLRDVAIRGNTTGNGGGIYVLGSVLLERVEISGNTADGVGGGGILHDGAELTATNVTISGNSSPAGGGMFLRSQNNGASFTNVTVANNQSSAGSGMNNDSPAGVNHTFRNTIMANNTGSGNCAGRPPVSSGNNLDSGSTCGFTASGDLQNTNPNLGPLATNPPGTTQTHALMAGSPAIDAGTNTQCPTTDQRGVARPVDGDENGTATCDIGAYEFQPAGPGQVDLSILKTDSADPATVGTAFTYTLTVNNAGPQSATSVSVSDTLPSGVTVGDVTPSQGTCTRSGQTVTCSLGTIASGGSAEVAIEVTPTSAGTLSNTATVSAAETDSNAANNSDTETTQVQGGGGNQADVSITKTDSTDPATVETPFDYTLTVNNAGPQSATSVGASDTLPSGVTVGSVTASQGTCTQSGQTVTCSLGTIASGGSATVTIRVTPNAEGTLSNTATASATEQDPTTANNSDTETTQVQGGGGGGGVADVSLSKMDSADPATVGFPFTYTLTVRNDDGDDGDDGDGDDDDDGDDEGDGEGGDPATGVIVTDPLPDGVTFNSATASQGSCAESHGTVTCSLGTILPGQSAAVNIEVTPIADGTLRNTATVTADEEDPDPSNNSDREKTRVEPAASGEADLSIDATDSVDPATAGSPFTYTLSIRNASADADDEAEDDDDGDDDDGEDDDDETGPATDVTVIDRLPEGVTFGSAMASQGSCSESNGRVSCVLGTLAPGGSATVTIEVTPTEEGTLTNRARVGAAQHDPHRSNNSDTETTEVNSAPEAESTSPPPEASGSPPAEPPAAEDPSTPSEPGPGNDRSLAQAVYRAFMRGLSATMEAAS